VSFFTRLSCLTEHVDLLRQRFLDHFPQIFEHMPAIEHLFDLRRHSLDRFPVAGTPISADDLHASMAA